MITNEIKFKVFAQYFGQKFKSNAGSFNFEKIQSSGELDFGYTVDEVKLILKPISKITDEDAIELYESNGFPNLHRKAPDEQLKEWGHNEEAIKKIKADTVKNCIKSIWQDFPLFLSDFLRSKGYDIPNYLLGGKTLFEFGLAVYE